MYHHQKAVLDSFNFSHSNGIADRSVINPLKYHPRESYNKREWFADFVPDEHIHANMAHGTAHSAAPFIPDYNGGHSFKRAEHMPARFRIKEYDLGPGVPLHGSVDDTTLMLRRGRDEYYTSNENGVRYSASREFEKGLASALVEFEKREAARKGGAALTAATSGTVGTIATSSTVFSTDSLDATPVPAPSPPRPSSPISLSSALSSPTPVSSLLPPVLPVGPITTAATTKPGGDTGAGGKGSGKQSPVGKPSAAKEPPASPGHESGDDSPKFMLRMPTEIETLYDYIKSQTGEDVDQDTIDKLNTELEREGFPSLHGNTKKKESIVDTIKELYTQPSGKPTGKTTKVKKSRKSV